MTSRSALRCPQDRSLAPLAPGSSLLRRLVRWWQRGRAIDELKALPDAQLRDIGIERYDVEALINRELNRFRSW